MREGDISTGNISQVNTGFFGLASGTTAQRPASPTVGMLRFNSELAAFEVYRGTSWRVLDDVMNNLTATSVPTAGDDALDGYSIGSVWQAGSAQWYCTSNTTSAAKWSLVGSPRAIPGMQTNIYHTTPYDGALSNFVVNAANMYAIPFRSDPYQVVTRIGFHVVFSSFLFGGGVTAGIYSSVNGAPGTLLLNCGTASTLSTGDKEITISYTMPNAWVWLVLLCESGFTMQGIDAAAGGPSILGRGSSTVGPIRGYQNALTYASGLPSTYPTVSANVADAPHIWLRKV